MNTTKKLLLVFVLTITGANAYQNEQDGFGGIKWGTEIRENITEMWSQSASTVDANIVYYKRKNDKQSLAGMALPEITYVYYKDKFAAVEFSSGNKTALLKAFTARFGPGEVQATTAANYLWHGASTVITLKCETTAAVCDATFYAIDYLRQLGVVMPPAIVFDKNLVEKKARAAFQDCARGVDKSGRGADAYYAGCEALAYAQWQAGLEQVYSELVNRLGAHCQDKLKDAHDAWQDLRKADFAANDAIYSARPGNSQANAAHKTAYVMVRVNYLNDLLYVVQAADPFDPKIRECIVFKR